MAYLSQLVEFDSFSASHFNLITSPCGSGKTQLAVKYLKHFGERSLGLTLYVIDVNNNKNHFLHQFKDVFTIYENSWMRELERKDENWINFTEEEVLRKIGENSRTIIINYAQLGGILSHYPDFMDYLTAVVFDEPHHFYKYNGRYISKPLSQAQLVHNKICDISRNTDVMVLGITATPKRLYSYIPNHLLYLVPYNTTKLNKYYTPDFAHYTNTKKAVDHIVDLKRKGLPYHTLVYTPYIRSMHTISQFFTDMGLNVVCLHSRNNAQYPYSPFQTDIYNYLLKFQRFPSNIDVVIINAAFETGMNIEDSRFKVFYAQTSDVESIIQARGRIRSDLEETIVVCKSDKVEEIRGEVGWEEKKQVEKPVESIWLDKQQIEDMIKQQDIRNNGRLVSVKAYLEMLTEQGREIKSERRMINKERKTRYLIT